MSAGDESHLDQRKEALRHCLDKLSTANRRLIELRYFKTESYPKISRKVNKTVGALYVIFSRLHQALSECVQRQSDSV
jgi:RNA polymerase sigma-70 factor (ECF subfamily)